MSNSEQVKFSELAHFTPKQLEANRLLSKFKFLLYGGAMGGGKSYWLRWELLLLLLKWGQQGHKNVQVGLFCEDYPTLHDRHLSKIRFEFPDWLGTLKESGTREFVLKPEYGSGVICFRNLDDSSKYQSAEFAAIGVDELTKNDESVFDFLRTRLRWPNIEDVKFLASTNPGDIGHVWVKKRFIDREFGDNEKEAAKFGFLQALADDNPYLATSYIDSLDSLPPELRKAFRSGDWNVFKGQFFSMWRESRGGSPYHVISHYEPTKYDQIFASCDWGFAPDAFAYHLHAVTRVVMPEKTFNRIITFAELYGTNKYPKDWAEDIIALEKNLPTKVVSRIIDPSANNKFPLSSVKQGGGSSIVEEFGLNGIRFILGNNDKKNGYQAQRNWLSEAPDGLPYSQTTWACPNLIKQMPAAVYDDNNSFVTKEGGEDHAREGTRYFMVSRPFNAIEVKKKIKENTDEYFEEMERKQYKKKVVLI